MINNATEPHSSVVDIYEKLKIRDIRIFSIYPFGFTKSDISIRNSCFPDSEKLSLPNV